MATSAIPLLEAEKWTVDKVTLQLYNCEVLGDLLSILERTVERGKFDAVKSNDPLSVILFRIVLAMTLLKKQRRERIDGYLPRFERLLVELDSGGLLEKGWLSIVRSQLADDSTERIRVTESCLKKELKLKPEMLEKTGGVSSLSQLAESLSLKSASAFADCVIPHWFTAIFPKASLRPEHYHYADSDESDEDLFGDSSDENGEDSRKSQSEESAASYVTKWVSFERPKIEKAAKSKGHDLAALGRSQMACKPMAVRRLNSQKTAKVSKKASSYVQTMSAILRKEQRMRPRVSMGSIASRRRIVEGSKRKKREEHLAKIRENQAKKRREALFGDSIPEMDTKGSAAAKGKGKAKRCLSEMKKENEEDDDGVDLFSDLVPAAKSKKKSAETREWKRAKAKDDYAQYALWQQREACRSPPLAAVSTDSAPLALFTPLDTDSALEVPSMCAANVPQMTASDDSVSPEKQRKELAVDCIPPPLRVHEWLWKDCNALTAESRREIVDFMLGNEHSAEDGITKKDIAIHSVVEKGKAKMIVCRLDYANKKWSRIKKAVK